MTDVQQVTSWIPMTRQMVEDGPGMHDQLTEMLALETVHKRAKTRYWRIQNAGYMQALEDIRSGRLVLEQGETRPVFRAAAYAWKGTP